jgi:ribonuclease T1
VFWFGQAPRQTSLKQFAPKLGLAIFLAALMGVASGAIAKPDPQMRLSEATVSLASLPAEARETKKLILSGGPFAFHKDGTVFGNRERLLPKQQRGFYREYTVKTPGSKDRGARRIVCGGQPPTQPEACFYTADHYASFRRIVQ